MSYTTINDPLYEDGKSEYWVLSPEGEKPKKHVFYWGNDAEHRERIAFNSISPEYDRILERSIKAQYPFGMAK